MLSRELRMGMMAAGWFVFLAACGGSDTNSGTGTTGSGGASGTTTTGTTTGAGGGTAGTGAGGRGNMADAGRIACGTANNSTGCNPNGNNRVCDLTNNRCVQCTSDADCAANPQQMGNPFCDTVGMNMAGLPNDTCEQCIVDTQCPAGNVCLNNNCRLNCTSDAQCLAANAATPICNTAVTPGQCVGCLNDTQCVGVTDMNGVPRPHCRLPMTQNANTCRACITAADCLPGQTCGNTGNCNMGFDGGMGRGGNDAAAGG
jgi:Cys-rich repeat protein